MFPLVADTFLIQHTYCSTILKTQHSHLNQQGLIVYHGHETLSCVANQIVNEKQHTIRFYVDDILSSHVDSSRNDES